jgi:ribokinase
MRKRPRIVVIGSLVFDFVARAERLPRKHETILGDAFGMFPGGKGANQAVQAARLGAEVFMIGRVGKDWLGERLLASLQENGVATDFVQCDPSLQTGSCCIHVDKEGSNSIIIAPQANSACCEVDCDAAENLLQSADILLCQLEIPLATVAYAVERGAAHGLQVILNPAPAQGLPRALLPRITMVTPNEIEAEILTGIPRPAQAHEQASWTSRAARQLRDTGVPTVIVTLGAAGVHLLNASAEWRLPAFAVPVVDTTAAGDAFNGALAVAVAEGMELKKAILFASAAAALATTRAGAQPSMPRREEVESFLEERRPDW